MKPIIAPILPVFNLSPAQVTNIVDGLPRGYDAPICIYNDQDEHLRTYLKYLEEQNRIRIVYIPFQVGKAEAIRRGLRALLKASEAEIIIQIDGRGKQPPEEAAGIVQKLIESGAHMIVGTRYEMQDMQDQTHRATISGLFSTIVDALTGIKLQDTACGLRGYVRTIAERFCNLRSFGYGLELEQILIASSLGMSVGAWPVRGHRQTDSTNAEKIEDNIFTLINYGYDVRMPDSIRAILSFMLVKIKQRNTFEIDLANFGRSGQIRFKYIGGNRSVVGGYTNQTIIDSYMVSPI